MLDKMKIKKTKERELVRKKQKRQVQQTILQKVKELKEDSELHVVIDDENFDGVESMWTSTVHSYDANRYLD